MRRLLIICSIATVLVASMVTPGPAAAQDATPCPPTTEAENVAQARRWTEEALDQANLDVLDEFVAEDIVHDAALYDPLVGRDQVKELLAQILRGFPDMRFSIVAAVAEGDYVAVGWRGEGVHGGEYLGVAPTGKRVVQEGITIYRFSCGQIVESWTETDDVGLHTQLVAADEAEPVDGTPPTAPGSATPADCPTATEEENRAIAVRWFTEVWSQQRYDVIAELAAEDFLHHWGVFEFTTGHEAFLAQLDVIHNAISGLRLDPVIVIADGDLVAIRWEGSGTHTGNFLGVEPTGEALEWAGNSIIRFACGRVVEYWVETDVKVRLGGAADIATPAI